MNVDDWITIAPWGAVPEGIEVGQWVRGESCTDLKGPREGRYEGLHGCEHSSARIACLRDADGERWFVHAGSVEVAEPEEKQ